MRLFIYCNDMLNPISEDEENVEIVSTSSDRPIST